MVRPPDTRQCGRPKYSVVRHHGQVGDHPELDDLIARLRAAQPKPVEADPLREAPLHRGNPVSATLRRAQIARALVQVSITGRRWPWLIFLNDLGGLFPGDPVLVNVVDAESGEELWREEYSRFRPAIRRWTTVCQEIEVHGLTEFLSRFTQHPRRS
jgi:hypothetical protein